MAIVQGNTPDFEGKKEEQQPAGSPSAQESSTHQSPKGMIISPVEHELMERIVLSTYDMVKTPPLDLKTGMISINQQANLESALMRLVPYMVFTTNMQFGFDVLTREDLINVISPEDEDLAYLLRETDIGDAVNNLHLSSSSPFSGMPNVVATDLEDKLKISSINNLFACFNDNEMLSIPDYECFSLFLDAGKQFLDYLQHNPDQKAAASFQGYLSNMYRINGTIKSPFTTARLRAFAEKTKQLKISYMVRNTEGDMNYYKTMQDQQPLYEVNAAGLLTNIYKSLLKNHPLLTLEGRQQARMP